MKKNSNRTRKASAQEEEKSALEQLDISLLETWLWDAACVIRGPADAPKFKDFILPLIFYKRLSDVFDDECAQHVQEFGDEAIAREIIEADHEDALRTNRKPIVRFYVPGSYRWDALRNHPVDGLLGEFVTEAMREVARLNPDLQGVLDIKDFNERQSGQRVLDDDRLAALIEIISRHRLGLKNTEPDILGRAYEYLLRKFAEGQGQSAGEFYTPKEVGWLMAHLLNPEPYTTAYDPACGSAGLLIKARLHFLEKHSEKEQSRAPRLYGQELNSTTFAIAKMNMFLYDFTNSYFAIGDTLKRPGFVANGAGLKRFDYVVANPMWNDPNYDDSLYESDSWNRFPLGFPPKSSADWGWVQHMFASLNDRGKAAIVLDTGAVSRGSGNTGRNRERDIRKELVDRDFVEAVILLPENLFYNTTAPGIIILLNKIKKHKNEILLINASKIFKKGRPKNYLPEEEIPGISKLYHDWKAEADISAIITTDEAAKNDYNLSPSRYVAQNGADDTLQLEDALVLLREIEEERSQVDQKMREVLKSIGVVL